MNSYKFGWGNRAKVEQLFHIASPTLNRWLKDKPMRCELLECALNTLEWYQEHSPGLINAPVTSENVESYLHLIGFTQGLSKACLLLDDRHQWATRQVEQNPALLWGLFLGLSHKAIESIKSEKSELIITTIERRATLTGLFYTNKPALQMVLSNIC